MDRDRFIGQLRDIVGDRNVIFHPEDLLVYEYDASIDRGLPQAVVLPADTDEVSRVMALAYR
ncbi:MAG: FAD-binding oxidoreductase, partial [Chloroflexi bacterium]|nr:FAD-binding oxidoreductase [Chloroflexota bacterium]